jgi:hypothetical protein
MWSRVHQNWPPIRLAWRSVQENRAPGLQAVLPSGLPTSVVELADGRLASGSFEGTVRIWEPTSGVGSTVGRPQGGSSFVWVRVTG